VSAFGRGLRQRNPLVLVVAGLLLLPALLGVQQLFLSGIWTAVPLETAMRNREDSFTYISWTVGRLRRDPPPGPALYLLGGSSARESIVSGDALAAEIAAAGGPRVNAYDLGSMNQTFAQSLTVVESVPDTPAWLLVGVNLGRFTAARGESAQQAKGRELLLDSSSVQEFVSSRWGMGRHDYTILPGIWAYLVDWSRRHGRDLLSAETPSSSYKLHRYSARTRRSDAQKRRLVDKWLTSRRPVFERNLQSNLEMLAALLTRARERNVRVVLLELPLNQEIVGDRFAAVRRQYQAPVTRLAGEYDVPYLDLNRTVTIPSRDFQDLSHLIAPGRVVWQHALAEELARLLAQEDPGGSSG
jgi:hypothetical protein